MSVHSPVSLANTSIAVYKGNSSLRRPYGHVYPAVNMVTYYCVIQYVMDSVTT